jgi:hypothetical protein
MKIFLLLPAAALSLGFTLPFGHQQQLSRAGLERALGNQMNGSPAGRITQRVRCNRVGPASGSTRYLCTLTSVRGTHERAVVVVDGSGWRADWAPIDG